MIVQCILISVLVSYARVRTDDFIKQLEFKATSIKLSGRVKGGTAGDKSKS